MTNVKSLVDGRWAVNFTKRDVKKGDLVSFDRHADAVFLVQRGQAEFISPDRAAVAVAMENKAAFPTLEQGAPVAKKKARKAPAGDAE